MKLIFIRHEQPKISDDKSPLKDVEEIIHISLIIDGESTIDNENYQHEKERDFIVL